MPEIQLKSAPRKTTVSRAEIRKAVIEAFARSNGSHSTKSHPKKSSRRKSGVRAPSQRVYGDPAIAGVYFRSWREC